MILYLKYLSMAPRGKSWGWDVPLVLSFVIGNMLVFGGFTLIGIIGVYIYKRGNLKSLDVAYPSLWKWGLAFVCLCGLARLTHVIEVWKGDWIYYLDSALTLATGLSAFRFVALLWDLREDIIIVALVTKQLIGNDKKVEHSNGHAGEGIK